MEAASDKSITVACNVDLCDNEAMSYDHLYVAQETSSITVVGPEEVPTSSVLIGFNAPGRGKWPVAEEYIRRDCERAGLTVIKLLGRLTVAKMDGQSVERLFCFRLRRGKEVERRSRKPDGDPMGYRCRLGAGEGTLHAGAGACKRHGGKNYARTNFTGIGENNHRASLVRYDVANALLGTDGGAVSRTLLEQLDILDELVLQRQMLNEYLNNTCLDEDGQVLATISGEVIKRVMGWTSEVTKTVERARRIENESALTKAHILYLIDALTRLGKRYVPQDKLREYGAELLSSFGLEISSVEALREPSRADIGTILVDG